MTRPVLLFEALAALAIGAGLLPIAAAAQQQQRGLCVRFVYQASKSPAEAEDSARRQTALSGDWLTEVMGAPAQVAPCNAAPIATVDALIYNSVSRVYVGTFTIPAFVNDQWSRRMRRAWQFTFDANQDCDTEQFFALVSALIDYRRGNKLPVPTNLEHNLRRWSGQQQCVEQVRLGSSYVALKERIAELRQP